MAIPMPLSLGFSSSDRTSANSGAPVSFGAVSFGGNASGGGSAPNAVDQSGGATSVLPQVTTSLQQGIADALGGVLGGANGSNPFDFGQLGKVALGAGTGLNGGQVQDPRMLALLEEGDGGPGAVSGGGAPSMIGLVALGVGVIAAAFIWMR